MFKKVLTKVFKGLLALIVLLVGIFGIFLLYTILTDYVPEEVEKAELHVVSDKIMPADKEFKITTYNIGYCGLDKNQDFFMDGGKMSKSSSLEKTEENLQAVIKFLREEKSDFYAIQEVDVKSMRSFNINQKERIAKALSGYNYSFAYNYKVKWIPVPLFDPMGYTNSGLLTLSKYKIDSSTRYALPGKESFPRRYFMLDRCITENIIPLSNDKKLYFVNLHLSAFDKGGAIRSQQIKFLINYIKEKYVNGNYVILAGDWNHLLSQSFLKSFKGKLPNWVALLPKELLEQDFTIVADDNIHTIRSTATPYVKGKSFETIIDGFFVSNNIEVVEIKGHDLKFEHTDHNPVSAILKFK